MFPLSVCKSIRPIKDDWFRLCRRHLERQTQQKDDHFRPNIKLRKCQHVEKPSSNYIKFGTNCK